jgi:hypothetical protein
MTRAECYRGLAGFGFVPPEVWPVAVNDRLGTALPVTPTAAAAAVRRVAAEADELAAEFWALPPDERRRHWAGLSARAADGPTAAFLAHLERGLDAVTVSHPDPAADAVAGIGRELLTLRPRPRAVRRMEWLVEKVGDDKTWPATVRALWAAAPAEVGFDPQLVNELAWPGWAPRAVPGDPSAARKQPATPEGMPEWAAIVAVILIAAVAVVAGWMGANDAHRLKPPAPPVRSDFVIEANKALNGYTPGDPRPAAVSETLWRLAGGDPKAPPPTKPTRPVPRTPPTRR